MVVELRNGIVLVLVLVLVWEEENKRDGRVKLDRKQWEQLLEEEYSHSRETMVASHVRYQSHDSEQVQLQKQ